jgi:FlaA1/EpsC-like NDP-sugar epimerase
MIDLTFDSHAPGIAYGYLQGLARFILSLSYKRRFTDAGLDIVLITAAYFGAFLIRFDFMVDDGRVALMVASLPRVIVATWIAFLFAGVYRGIWRYASFSDVWRFANGCMLTGFLVVLLSMSLMTAPSRSITALYVILLFNLVVASRLSFRGLRKAVALLAARTDRVLIVGAGEMAEAAARYIVSSRSRNLRLVGFADDDNFKLGKFVHGYKVLGTIEELAKIHAGTAFNQILVAAEMIAGDRIALVRAFANAHQLAVRRFSIRLNEMGISAEPASAGRAPLELKSQANEVVA